MSTKAVIEGPEGYIGSQSWSTRIRKKVKELVRYVDTDYMEMAKLLYLIWDTPVDGDPRRGPVYELWGYSSFEEWVEKDLGLDYAKAKKLRQIYYRVEIEMSGLDPALKRRLGALPYTKVRELIKILTIRNAEKLIARGEAGSSREVELMVAHENRRLKEAEAQGLPVQEVGDLPEEQPIEPVDDRPFPKEPETYQRQTFHFFPKQLRTLNQALSRAKEITRSDKKGHLLEMICLDYLASNDSLASDPDKRLRYLAKMERTLGVLLIVVDPETKDVVYGIKALEMAAAAGREPAGEEEEDDAFDIDSGD